MADLKYCDMRVIADGSVNAIAVKRYTQKAAICGKGLFTAAVAYAKKLQETITGRTATRTSDFIIYGKLCVQGAIIHTINVINYMVDAVLA